MSDSDVTGATPAGAPAGGSSLSSDDDPTGNDGTAGKSTPSGDAGTGGVLGALDDDGLDDVDINDDTSTGGAYSEDPETNTEITEELDR